MKQHLLFLCTCFKSQGKQRRDMIPTANRGKMEAICEMVLNLLNEKVSFPRAHCNLYLVFTLPFFRAAYELNMATIK